MTPPERPVSAAAREKAREIVSAWERDSVDVLGQYDRLVPDIAAALDAFAAEQVAGERRRGEELDDLRVHEIDGLIKEAARLTETLRNTAAAKALAEARVLAAESTLAGVRRLLLDESLPSDRFGMALLTALTPAPPATEPRDG